MERDRAGRRFGHVVGTLTLAVAGDDVTWTEAGMLAWAGHDLSVQRRLVMRRQAHGWTVCFEDGRAFHPWTPGRPVVHDCGADTYRGLVAADGDELRVLWDVTGPSKDCRLFTRCKRS